MNRVLKHIERKSLIVRTLTLLPYSPTLLLYNICFPGAGLYMAQKTLKKMSDRGELQRFKESTHGEYIYHLSPQRSQNWRSHVYLARVYLWLKKHGQVIQYQPELPFPGGQADAFIVAEYRGIKKKYFIEIDRHTSPFKKSKIYNALYSYDWPREPWADPLKSGNISFPIVAVFTESRSAVERDFLKAQFPYLILDLPDPRLEVMFHGKPYQATSSVKRGNEVSRLSWIALQKSPLKTGPR